MSSDKLKKHAEPRYIIKHGEYYYAKDGVNPGPKGSTEIAIAMDTHDAGSDMPYTMLKHGDPELVTKWFNAAVEKYKAAGLDDIADQMILVQGQFELEELNKFIGTSGYGKRFLENHGIKPFSNQENEDIDDESSMRM
jgi:hypothetical protein